MTIDKAKLKALAEAATGFHDVELAPDVLLALLAEINRVERRRSEQREKIKSLTGNCSALGKQIGRLERERDQIKAENEALRKDAERFDNAVQFVRQLRNAAGSQPSVATGYLDDILGAMAKDSTSNR